MEKILMIAPMGSVHRRFNTANIEVLSDMGYEVHLVANFDNSVGTESQNSKFVNTCKNSNIIIHSIPFKRKADMRNFRFVAILKHIIENENFVLIHAHTETGGLLLRLVILLGCKKFKAIYTPHGMSFYDGSSILSQLLYRPIEHWICTAMHKNLAMNIEELNILKKWGNNSAAFVHGVGVDTAKFKIKTKSEQLKKELGIPADSIILTSIGELNKNKNHIVVIEALAMINDKNIYYLICGVGSKKKVLMKKAKKKGVNLKLLGFRDDISHILSISDIFLFPSYHEGLPVSVIEAMASSLPVICSNIRGNADLIDDNGGIKCNPKKASEFAQAITKLLTDIKLRKTMGLYNLGRSELYDTKNVKRELRDIYGG